MRDLERSGEIRRNLKRSRDLERAGEIWRGGEKRERRERKDQQGAILILKKMYPPKLPIARPWRPYWYIIYNVKYIIYNI